ncbi:MAG: hypothetical protein R3190_08435 [Thermoanaerobaculia bacterium]|nr:hypothetical protein [Thermoanaerobaculia bacterium]
MTTSDGLDAPSAGRDESRTDFRIRAFNYATDSTNRIHSDEGARRYGFRGGLVPGIADYAYMTRPVLGRLGCPWMESGWMEAKLLKPVYDGDEVRVTIAGDEELRLELRDPAGVLCAVGSAGLTVVEEAPRAADYPVASPPPAESRPPASLDTLVAGKTLGALDVSCDAQSRRDWIERWGEAGRIPDELTVHPAVYPDLGNRILDRNVLLGPWIHTESRAVHFAAPAAGEPIEVRGKVARSFAHKGHDFAVLDVAFFGRDARALARLVHTAIVRPRPVEG